MFTPVYTYCLDSRRLLSWDETSDGSPLAVHRDGDRSARGEQMSAPRASRTSGLENHRSDAVCSKIEFPSATGWYQKRGGRRPELSIPKWLLAGSLIAIAMNVAGAGGAQAEPLTPLTPVELQYLEQVRFQ